LENSKKILVVDDEAHIRRVIELKLKNRGYEVITASDGEEGLNIIQQQRPDAVITDIMMPKLDGKALSEQTNDYKKEWPFLTVVMTCRISPDEHEWVKRMKDTVLMEKPFSPSKLIEFVDSYFGGEN
jgi:CheY-like chemotaxis protein